MLQHLKTLSLKEQLVLDLIYHRNLSIDEVAIVLEHSPEDAERIRKQALLNLKQILADEDHT